MEEAECQDSVKMQFPCACSAARCIGAFVKENHLMMVVRSKFSILAAFLLLVVTAPVMAQGSGKLQVLMPSSVAVLQQLDSLGSLPAVEWRVHDGNMPHGESVSLDDTAWQVVTLGLGMRGNGAGWLRATVVVPKNVSGFDITGSRISLRSPAAGSPVIVYFNGRRVAMGEDLESITLFDNAIPGDKVVVAIKILAPESRVTIPVIHVSMESRTGLPDPLALREEILTVAAMLPALPGASSAKSDALNAIVGSIRIDALKKGDSKAFAASLSQAHNELKQFRAPLKTVTIDMVGNSHIDAAWLWPESETVDVVHRTFGTALQLMHEYPEYKFTQSAALYNSWIASKYPDMNREIKQRIVEGRWEIVGGMWVEPDLNMPDGESIVRQLLVGKRFYKKEYGVDVRIGWNPDTFGYTWQLPQIYKKSGIDYFVTQKMVWSETNKLPLKLFWWESPDGSKVLTYFPTGYDHSDLSPVRETSDFANAVKRNPGATDVMDLYGIGDHGGGPTRTTLDEGELWSRPDAIAPAMRFTTAQEFFSSVEKKITPNSPLWNYQAIAKGWKAPDDAASGLMNIPTWKDELYLEYHRGCYTTQAKHKEYMRRSEEALLDSEKYAALAWLEGKNYPGSDFVKSWQKVTFGQFHDLAAGSGIGVIYKEAAESYEEVLNQTHSADDVSLPALAAGMNTSGSGIPILVFNSLGWKRGGTVEARVQMDKPSPDGVHIVDSNGKPVLSQLLSQNQKTNSYDLLINVPNVPSLGYAVYHALPGAMETPNDLKADGFALENAYLKVVVSPRTGCITSLIEKGTGFEMIAPGGCGNQLQAFVDKPKQWDAWNIDPGTLDHFTVLDAADSVKLVEKGPLRATIEIKRSWSKSHFLEKIILEAGSSHVTFDTQADWQEEHVLLKAAFPTAATGANATYEIPYGTIDRPTLRENSWEKAMFEVPALRWADLGDGKHGLTLMNRTKYGYDAVGNWLRLSLLRSPDYPDPLADRGAQHFTYAVYPHPGGWQEAMSMRQGYEFNYPLLAMQVAAHMGAGAPEASYVAIDQDNVVLTAVKKAEDRNALVLRFFEWAGKSGEVNLHVPPGAQGAALSNMMENPTQSLTMANDIVHVPVKPYEIVTLQVNYAPDNR
jgi:alpha-mannosidase